MKQEDRPSGARRYYTTDASRVKGTLRKGLPQFTLTLPVYLFEHIRAEAVDQRRSFNSQVIVMLESCLSVPTKEEKK